MAEQAIPNPPKRKDVRVLGKQNALGIVQVGTDAMEDS